MPTTKLPCNISELQNELMGCMDDFSKALKRLSILSNGFSVKRKAITFKKNKPWVLLVESDNETQFIHQKALEELGCQVELAINAHDALAMANRGYDLILLNTSTLLPDMDGIQFAIRLGIQEQMERPRLIGVATTCTDGYLKSCLAAGFKEVISTPLTVKILKNLVSQHLALGEAPLC